ncbi:hypothetical protein [Roseicyclus marinus]|uniref:hypothetical protein n=1 Tax=Roseicyclus marinus TaxID=2161673 RepID=UPI00240F0E25|nr:hypothetical protein [Roseicyclus marinus]MDG3040452.1 hypothetical protein [Roseicyclus marinus]
MGVVRRLPRLIEVPSVADQVDVLRAYAPRDRLRALRCLDADARQAVWNGLTPAERAEVIRAVSSPPPQCGDAIPVAPARAPLAAFMPKRIEPTAAGGFREVDDGWHGLHAARVTDVFDVMEARRPKRARREGPLFTPSQVEVARDYRNLTERMEASGMRGMSLETMGGGKGGGVDAFIAAVLDDASRLRAMHRRIGDGVALAVRRIRPSQRGGDSRFGIRDRYLVDRVCLAQMTIIEVLESCGWAENLNNRRALVIALAGALDRMGKLL